MLTHPENKYQPFQIVNLNDRQWPNVIQQHAPAWCSVDMRDGNQALIDPMTIEQKRFFFKLLTEIGFKEIEVGFPAASQVDYDFIRELIEHNAIPSDVTIQVLTQAREDIIQKTFQALTGVPRAVVHVYNATAPVFRDVVFKVDKLGCKNIAANAARLIRSEMKRRPETEWIFEYSPETFCFTELDFSLENCEAVIDVMQPTLDNKMIVNLPTTVEVSTPNVFADQIEWFCRKISRRESLIISVHPHNDRGTAVATAELALLAGAQRIEGTLFGNGERTGNVDIFNLAMNLYSSGVNPHLNFSNIDEIVQKVTACTQLPLHPRHPYAGELVYTAFSGSHQDAIKKGFAARKECERKYWEVPYLPIDPSDIGRNYEAVIRLNSQSGKGGVAYILEEQGVILPRGIQIEFSRIVQSVADQSQKEISKDMVWQLFQETYLFPPAPFELLDVHVEDEQENMKLDAAIRTPEGIQHIQGRSNGPLAAYVEACSSLGLHFDIVDYHEHARSSGARSDAFAYVEILFQNKRLFGVGRHANILKASLLAVVCAMNRGVGDQLISFERNFERKKEIC
ncbi:2-isopropylmalate synthase [Desulfovibrio inopinatus]|uniref:2-isopropylmalate synthase n=1 Tax=Desulfovibrio inopinatus TaxID=102109 RepID=UPI001FE063D2|nr:2-isopropylmalate synthase [Desulfovibrio inopinatus]